VDVVLHFEHGIAPLPSCKGAVAPLRV
jgi:hypothetical protein